MPLCIAVHSMKGMYSQCAFHKGNTLLLKLNPQPKENIPGIDKMRPGIPA